MPWLNYHHLFYFWTVAREGSVAKACEQLLLAQPTISGQLRSLERALGTKLFDRVGRNLVLTDSGRDVYRYADEIFTLGQELQDSMAHGQAGRPPRLLVGIPEALPKLICRRILEPALHLPQPVQIVCHEAPPEQLLAQLAVHQLDTILSDSPAPPIVKVRVFNHLLGECGVSFCATPKLATAHRRRFPRSLDDAPFLLPLADTELRRSLDRWFESVDVRPRVRAEFADSALLKAFGESGAGIFVVPRAVEREVCRQYKVRVCGRVDSIREHFYLISPDRKLRNPTVAALAQLARQKLFT